jgi:hypothetical protein
MREVTSVTDPSQSGTGWTVVWLPGVQVTLLLTAATLGVFKPGGLAQRRNQPRNGMTTSHDETASPSALIRGSPAEAKRRHG